MMELQVVWGWQAAIYLFLGGAGGGALMLAGALGCSQEDVYRKGATTLRWVASACLLAGLLLLQSELIAPERALRMWGSFDNASSWMARGAWGVVAALAYSTVSAVVGAVRVWFASPVPERGSAMALRRISNLAAVLLGAFVALYAGLLLMSATGVPFWGTWCLPALFFVSALTSGLNLAVVVASLTGAALGERSRVACYASGASATLITAEGLLLAALLIGALAGGRGDLLAQQAASAASAEAVLFGDLAVWFWLLVVAVGLLVPFAFSIWGLASGGEANLALLLPGSVCALVGECALRCVVLYAGVPVDYIAYTLVAAF